MNSPQFTNITDSFSAVLRLAEQEAANRHSVYVDVEHLALGVLSHPGGAAHSICAGFSVDTQATYERIAAQLGMERPQPTEPKGYSRWAQAILQRATDEATALGHSAVSDGHLLLALICERDGIVHDAFAATPLTEYGTRAYLRDRLPASERGTTRLGPGRPIMGGSRTASSRPSLIDRARSFLGLGGKGAVDKRPNRRGRPVILVDPNQPRAGSDTRLGGGSNRLMIVGVILAIIAAMVAFLPSATVFTFLFVLIGWIFSVTLHEFSHALVAYWGGDYTVKDKGYLSFNPLKYAHPMLSIYMPLIFLLLGGIGLPGGAVYIETHRLKNKWWSAAVSAAGPASNFLFALLLALPFLVGLVDVNMVRINMVQHLFLSDAYRSQISNSFWENEVIWSAIGLLAMLNLTAVFFNLLPIPPLDGSGILEPFLDPQTRYQYLQIGRYGIMIVFFVFWFVDPVSHAFWNLVFDVTDALGIPSDVANAALIERFLFWRN